MCMLLSLCHLQVICVLLLTCSLTHESNGSGNAPTPLVTCSSDVCQDHDYLLVQAHSFFPPPHNPWQHWLQCDNLLMTGLLCSMLTCPLTSLTIGHPDGQSYPSWPVSVKRVSLLGSRRGRSGGTKLQSTANMQSSLQGALGRKFQQCVDTATSQQTIRRPQT